MARGLLSLEARGRRRDEAPPRDSQVIHKKEASMATKDRVLWGASVGLVLLSLSDVPVQSADFVRGDLNGDGVVSYADPFVLTAYLFLGHSRVEDCMAAAEINGDGHLDISDTIHLYRFVLGLRDAPSAPFPDPGPAPADETLSCDSYTSDATPIDDPAASIRIVDHTSEGGEDRLVMIDVEVSTSTRLAGLGMRLEFESGLFGEVGTLKGRGVVNLVGEDPEANHWIIDAQEDSIAVGQFIAAPLCNIENEDPECGWLPAGEDVKVFRLLACLAPNTPAGEYPIRIASAEFVDLETSRAIYPETSTATLTVLEDVGTSECDANPEAPPPPPPTPTVAFTLAERTASRGAAVGVPFAIRAELPSQGFSFSMDFDESVLTSTGIERLWKRPSGTPFEFEKFEINNANRFPGNQDLFEGYIAGGVIISFEDTSEVLPAGEDVEVLNLEFEIRPDAPLGETQLEFVDGAIGSDGEPVQNRLVSGGRAVVAATTPSFVLVNGFVAIVGVGTPFFLRGDTNADGEVQISDPVHTLGFLFEAGLSVDCLDAADANDDGEVNVTDPIFTLEFLFAGGPPIPPPYAEWGEDPTDDALECRDS